MRGSHSMTSSAPARITSGIIINTFPNSAVPAKAGTHSAACSVFEGQGDRLWYRSIQYGLFSSIRLIFHAQRHSLICFSRRNAPSRVSWISNQTSRSTPYFAVKPGTALIFMLPDAADQVVGHSGVQGSLRLAGQ